MKRLFYVLAALNLFAAVVDLACGNEAYAALSFVVVVAMVVAIVVEETK